MGQKCWHHKRVQGSLWLVSTCFGVKNTLLKRQTHFYRSGRALLRGVKFKGVWESQHKFKDTEMEFQGGIGVQTVKLYRPSTVLYSVFPARAAPTMHQWWCRWVIGSCFHFILFPISHYSFSKSCNIPIVFSYYYYKIFFGYCSFVQCTELGERWLRRSKSDLTHFRT